MIAVFYDRKNGRNVRSDELMRGFVSRSQVICEYKPDCFEDLSIYHEDIGELVYKTEDCPPTQNWDVYTNTNDLVFLYLIDV